MSKRPVLIIEDDREVREALQSVLEFDGYPVLVAASVREGIEILTASPNVALVLLDLLMPGPGGYDFLKQRSALGIGAAAQVVLLSGVRIADRPEGVAEILLKPVDPHRVLKVVAKHCG